MSIISFIKQEPLVHFLVFGAIMYGYYDIKNPPQTNIYEIKIDPKTLIQNKKVDKAYLNVLIQQKFYKEVLLNEAYALNLYKTDPIITKRLLNKMDQIIANTQKVHEPTEDELKKYYHKNQSDYSVVSSLSFTQIFLGDISNEEAKEKLKMLQRLDLNASVAPYFSQKFSHPLVMQNISFNDIKKIYGNYFAFKLFLYKKGRWQGVLQSSFGKHLIYITEKNAINPLPFEEVQERVYNDFIQEQRDKIWFDSFKKISKNYKLKIE